MWVELAWAKKYHSPLYLMCVCEQLRWFLNISTMNSQKTLMKCVKTNWYIINLDVYYTSIPTMFQISLRKILIPYSYTTYSMNMWYVFECSSFLQPKFFVQ